MHQLFSWLEHLQVAWLALGVSSITLILKFLECRTKLSIPQVYVTKTMLDTQKVILTLSNESSHAVSVTGLEFETNDLETFKPKFGNYIVWKNDSYTRYTDMLPVTLAANESKLLMFEIDNNEVRRFSNIKVSTVKKPFNLKATNQDKISLDTLAKIR